MQMPTNSKVSGDHSLNQPPSFAFNNTPTMTENDQTAADDHSRLSHTQPRNLKDMIRIQVGEGESMATFELPTDALKDSSDYFRALLKPEWTRNSNSSIRSTHLPEIEADIFSLYAEWLMNGAAILTEDRAWKAKYGEYLKWQGEVEKATTLNTVAPPRPEGVWDFKLTVIAWFMGDYLQSRKFQNHCLSHLYFLHLRFDPEFLSAEYLTSNDHEVPYHCGTVAYTDLADVLLTWQQSDHDARSPPTRPEDTIWELDQHPLRRFCADWLTQYWFAYEVSVWDDAVHADIDEMYKKCPDLACKLLRGLTCTSRPEAVASLDTYWIDVYKCEEETVWRAEEAVWTHRA